MIEAEIIKGLIYLLKEIPELNIAIISVLLASFEVNQITAKNKKGNPTQFSLRIEIDVTLVDNLNQKRQIKFAENSSYKNNDNKFDLKIYENNLTQNMSEKIFSDLILYIKNID